MATPCVVGVVSLILDANPNLSSQQVKNIIKTTARLDNYTGNIVAPGDTKWGMGKINAYAAVKLALNTLSTDEYANVTPFVLYPNPASNLLHILNINELPLSILSVTALDGKGVSPRFDENTLDVSELPDGIFFLKVQSGTEVYTLRFVKE